MIPRDVREQIEALGYTYEREHLLEEVLAILDAYNARLRTPEQVAVDVASENATSHEVALMARAVRADRGMLTPDPAPRIAALPAVGEWWMMRVCPRVVRFVVRVHGGAGERLILADEHGEQDYLATDLPLVADRCEPPLFSRRRAIERAAGLPPHATDPAALDSYQRALCGEVATSDGSET